MKATRFGVGLLCLLVAVPCFGAGAIRTESSLTRQFERAQKRNVSDRVKLLKTLKKHGTEWDLWVECRRVLRIDEKNRTALRYLPAGEPEQPKEEDPKIKQVRLLCNKSCVERLTELIERGQKGELSAQVLAPVAQAILSYNTNHSVARKVLGFTGKAFEWGSLGQVARISRVQAVLKKVKPAQVSDKTFPNLTKALGGGFRVFKSAHAYYATNVVNDADIVKLSRAVEATYEVVHFDLLGQSEFFKEDGRETTGSALKRFIPPLYLVLKGDEAHKRFLDKIVTNANLKVVGRRLAFCSTSYKPDKVTIFESRNGASNLQEWGALLMSHFILTQRFAMKKPIYLKNGLGHYYAGLVSGDARLAVVGKGTQSDADKKSMVRGSFLQLGWTARWAYENSRAPLPAKFGLRKDISGMNRGDVGLATAFADYLLRNKRSALLSYIRESQKSEVSADEAFEKSFGQSRDKLDQEFLKWFLGNY